MKIEVKTHKLEKKDSPIFITATHGQIPGLYMDNVDDLWLVDMNGNVAGHFHCGLFYPYCNGRFDLYHPRLIESSVEVILRNV